MFCIENVRPEDQAAKDEKRPAGGKSRGPAWMRKAARGWMRAGEKAAAVLGIVLFAILYGLVFAPTALIMKLSGRKFLPPLDDDAETWFQERTPTPATLDWMKRQW